MLRVFWVAPGADDAELRRLQASWAQRCRRLARRVAHLAAAPPFAEAGETAARLMLSSLFRRDPAYRRFFRLARDMNLGLPPCSATSLQMPLARTFDLYELWMLSSAWCAPASKPGGRKACSVTDLFITDAAGGVTLRRDAVTVPVGKGLEDLLSEAVPGILARRRTGRAPIAGPWSLTSSSSGDKATGESEPARLIVLDAKYRTDDGLGDALTSIHTYTGRAGPGGRSRPYRGHRQRRLSADASALPRPWKLLIGTRQCRGGCSIPISRRSFRFGALTLRPGMNLADIAAALQSVVVDATAS